MEKYSKRKLESPNPRGKNDDETKSSKIDINLLELPTDPRLRIPILEYKPYI